MDFKVKEGAEYMLIPRTVSSFTLAKFKRNHRFAKGSMQFSNENTIQDQTSETTKYTVKLLPSFSLSCDISKVFTKCLTGSSGGGCKKDRAAQQVVTRCLCSPNLLFKFIDYLQDQCQPGQGKRLCYIDLFLKWSTSENFMTHQRQFFERCLQQTSTSKERERQWQTWWNCTAHKNWKQEATGRQWRSCWRSWNFICHATWRFANPVQLRSLCRHVSVHQSERGHVPWMINIWRWTWLLPLRKRVDLMVRKRFVLVNRNGG